MKNNIFVYPQRMCSISKKKFPVNQLVKITYSKKMNYLFINDSKIKGRSVYFKEENILKIPLKKFNSIIFNKLKITPNSNMIDQLKKIFNKEI
ncbi:hypothetical protein [Malacoplasma muris]|uniref:hypothetical protein n=1 Tax=Malacoplasma muris TaxID=2119 RepID=UPI00398EB601